MPPLNINKKGPMNGFLDIYYRTFTIAIPPGTFEIIPLKSLPLGEIANCEGSIINIQKQIRADLFIDVRSTHVVFWPKILYSFCCSVYPVLPLLEIKLVILETKWNRLEIFCYGDRSHIRVQLCVSFQALPWLYFSLSAFAFYQYGQFLNYPLYCLLKHTDTTRAHRLYKM